MDAPLYDVYLTGKLTDGTAPDAAAQRLAALFKSTPEIMGGMLTGKPHLLKRGVDKNTALKYREALLKAGIEVAFRSQAGSRPSSAVSTAPAAPQSAGATHESDALTLAPAGSELLQPGERQAPAAVAIDTSQLQLAPPGPLSSGARAEIAAPDTSHLSLAAAGGDLLHDDEKPMPPLAVVDSGNFTLAEVGAPIETLQENAAPLNPDTSGLSLAAAGADLLTAAERSRPAPAPPDTDHIRLAD